MVGLGYPMTATSSQTERLRQLIVATGAYNSDPEPIFPLASGARSMYYIDFKKADSHAEVRKLVGELILEKVGSTPIDAVGGLVLGACSIADAVSDAFDRNGKDIPSFKVRKDPKLHGLRKSIEGDVNAGDRVLIVDDVVTRGQSTIKAIRTSQKKGLKVVKVIAVIDREEEDGANSIRAYGVSFESLITLGDLIATEAGSKVRLAR